MQMVMGLVMSLLIIAFGAIFQLSLFLHNSFGILFFLFFLFQLAMASFAFLCSIPIRKVGPLVMAPCSVCVSVRLWCLPPTWLPVCEPQCSVLVRADRPSPFQARCSLLD